MTTPKSFHVPGSDRQFFKGKHQGWRTVTDKEGPSPVGPGGSVVLTCVAVALAVAGAIWRVLSGRKT